VWGADSVVPGWVDTHCHLDMILERLGQEDLEQWRNGLPDSQAFGKLFSPEIQEQAIVPIRSIISLFTKPRRGVRHDRVQPVVL
jgi:hypothetical protein